MNNENEPKWGLTYVVIALIALGGLTIIWVLCLHYIPKQADRVQLFLQIAVNFLILMAMFVQAYITKRQWKAMREQFGQTAEIQEFTENSFYLAERAYVVIRNVRPFFRKPDNGEWGFVVGDRDPKFGFDIVNGGRTPAFNVSASVHTALAESLGKVSNWKQSLIPFRTDFLLPNEPHEFVSGNNVKPPHDYDEPFSATYEHFYFVKIVLLYWDISRETAPKKETYIFRYRRDERVIQWSRETDAFTETKTEDAAEKN